MQPLSSLPPPPSQLYQDIGILTNRAGLMLHNALQQAQPEFQLDPRDADYFGRTTEVFNELLFGLSLSHLLPSYLTEKERSKILATGTSAFERIPYLTDQALQTDLSPEQLHQNVRDYKTLVTRIAKEGRITQEDKPSIERCSKFLTDLSDRIFST